MSNEVQKSEDVVNSLIKRWGEKSFALCQLADNIDILVKALEHDEDHNDGQYRPRIIQAIKTLIEPHLPDRGA